MAAEKAKLRAVLVANKSYGLYICETAMTDDQIAGTVGTDGTMMVHGLNVRHVARWYGKTGGITSLAAHGPCGPSGSKSLVGAPSASALLSGVVNIFAISADAAAAFAAIVPTNG